MRPVVLATLLATITGATLSSMGCARGPDYRLMTSQVLTCDRDHIYIDRAQRGHGTYSWQASCDFRTYQCSADRDRRTTCTQVADTRSPTHAVQPVAAAPAAVAGRMPQVQRVVTREGYARLEMQIELDARWRMRLVAAPSRERERLVVELSVIPTRLQQHAQCAARVLVDGELIELAIDNYRMVGSRETIPLVAPIELLRRVAVARSAAGRFCDDEWAVQPGAQVQIGEFLRAFDRELQWEQAPAGSSGGPAPPASR